jgi:hypothetical protein
MPKNLLKLKRQLKRLEKKYEQAEGRPLIQERLLKQASVIENKIKGGN